MRSRIVVPIAAYTRVNFVMVYVVADSYFMSKVKLKFGYLGLGP